MANRKDGLPKKYRTNRVEIISIDGVECVKAFTGIGKYFLVDKDYWFTINTGRWDVDLHGYVKRCFPVNGKIKVLKMHRLIMNAPNGVDVDHINRNRADNRKCNLRLATRSQNSLNRLKDCDNTHGFKGIEPYGKNKNYWRASLGINGKRVRVNGFTNKIEAAIAYNFLAKHYFGQFALLNDVKIL